MEQNERLRHARIEAGFQSAADAARRLGISYGTYSGHENGLRGIKESEIQKYARAFSVSPEWLRSGRLIKYLGHVPAYAFGEAGTIPDGSIKTFEGDDLGAFILVPHFSEQPMSFIIIKGTLLKGIASVGDTLLHHKKFIKPGENSPGDLCVCRMKDEKLLIRNVYPGSSSFKFHLSAFNSEPLYDVDLFEISPIISILTPYAINMLRDRTKNFSADYLGLPPQEIEQK